MELALEAILGQRSAHSLATGPAFFSCDFQVNFLSVVDFLWDFPLGQHVLPVIAEPFISPLLFTITPGKKFILQRVKK